MMRALLTSIGFLLLLGAAVLLQKLPAWIWWLDCGASLLAMLLYADDKRAAIAARARISERTLHAVALAGGWPGAMAAQALFRHKTVKRRFRMVFWLTVLINCAAPAAWLVHGWR